MNKSLAMHKDLPVLTFSSAADFDKWLSKNHQRETAVWLKYFKKISDKPKLKHEDIIDVALCWGWIDGLANSLDEESYLIRFTKRRPKSIWSKINVAKVEKLISAGKMQPSGMEQVNAAKQDGRWEKAYHPQSSMEVPLGFINRLKKDADAYDFFMSLNKANVYAIAFRLTTVVDPKKQKIKEDQILEMLKSKQKFH